MKSSTGLEVLNAGCYHCFSLRVRWSADEVLRSFQGTRPWKGPNSQHYGWTSKPCPVLPCAPVPCCAGEDKMAGVCSWLVDSPAVWLRKSPELCPWLDWPLLFRGLVRNRVWKAGWQIGAGLSAWNSPSETNRIHRSSWSFWNSTGENRGLTEASKTRTVLGS